MVRPTQKQYNDFVRKHIAFEGDSNVTQDFGALSKTAGVPYFEFLRAAWAGNDGILSESEFCRINGNVPSKFFEKNVRDSEITREMQESIVTWN